jgi:hypothetical protein
MVDGYSRSLFPGNGLGGGILKLLFGGSEERILMRVHGFLWSFHGVLVVLCGRLKCEGPPQLSLQAALFDLSFKYSEPDITHTPTLAKIS